CSRSPPTWAWAWRSNTACAAPSTRSGSRKRLDWTSRPPPRPITRRSFTTSGAPSTPTYSRACSATRSRCAAPPGRSSAGIPDADIQLQVGGLEHAVTTIAARAGRGFDPTVANAFVRDARAIASDLEASAWDAMLDAEPSKRPELAGTEIDDALAAIGDFADLKSPYTLNHAAGVSALAGDAARAGGLTEDDEQLLRRAGSIHDVGRVAVTSLVWEKRGPLSPDERERTRLHAYQTGRICSASAFLAPIARVAPTHREWAAGSGHQPA